MKKTIILILLFSFGIFLSCDAQKSECPFDISADLVSSFIWRGSKMGNGPAIQPTLEFVKGGLAIGAWGSYYFSDSDAAETDLYAGYSFDSGLNIGVNDYYFPATSFFKVNNHAIELNGAFQAGNFNFSANYVINEGAGSAGGDTYFEVGYKAGNVNLFAGAGNGWHTSDYRFAVCNIGLSASKEIKITDSFSVPLTGSVIFNPETEKLFIVVGITL